MTTTSSSEEDGNYRRMNSATDNECYLIPKQTPFTCQVCFPHDTLCCAVL